MFAHGWIKGAAHITGGGIPGNLPRVLPPRKRAWIDRRTWKSPAIFGLIQKIGRVSQEEMDRTFNNGLGMILVVAKADINAVTRSLAKMGETHFLVGDIRNGDRGVSF
jgi:phosphoribosylformylglycinamidine cyclo-ligase